MVAITGILVNNTVRIGCSIFIKVGFIPSCRHVRPRKFREQNDSNAFSLHCRDRLLEFLKGSQSWISVLGGVASILASLIPSNKMDCCYTILDTFVRILRQVCISDPKLFFRGIQLQLVP